MMKKHDTGAIVGINMVYIAHFEVHTAIGCAHSHHSMWNINLGKPSISYRAWISLVITRLEPDLCCLEACQTWRSWLLYTWLRIYPYQCCKYDVHWDGLYNTICTLLYNMKYNPISVSQLVVIDKVNVQPVGQSSHKTLIPHIKTSTVVYF